MNSNRSLSFFNYLNGSTYSYLLILPLIRSSAFCSRIYFQLSFYLTQPYSRSYPLDQKLLFSYLHFKFACFS